MQSRMKRPRKPNELEIPKRIKSFYVDPEGYHNCEKLVSFRDDSLSRLVTGLIKREVREIYRRQAFEKSGLIRLKKSLNFVLDRL